MKINYIKKIKKECQTYSLTVEGNHNYFMGSRNGNILCKNSQMEVRVLAKLSNDPELLKLFEDESTDIHRMIASKVFKKDPKLISSTERKFAKTATFGILYGKSIYNFAQEMLNGDTKYAQEIFDSLFQAFPGIQRYINEYHLMALTAGKVKTIFGDELSMDMVPDIVFSLPHQTKMKLIENPYNDEIQLSSNRQEDRLMKRNLGQSLRDAQNWPIQSSASSIAGACIYNIVKYLKERNLSTKVDCFTHDAGDMDLELKDLSYVIKVLKREAVEVPKSKYGIPVNIDFAIGISGNNLLDLEECVVSEDEKIITTKFSGKRLGFEGMLKRLDNSGIEYEYTITSEEEKNISLDELFTEKGEFSLESQKYVEIEGDLKLIYS
jgi:DNA polymerase I-like protein with 3'-5' exonuclease and polymerase domains